MSILPLSTTTLIQWVADFLKIEAQSLILTLLVGDASPRQYYRVKAMHQSYILMVDDNAEQCLRFLTIAHGLYQNGVHVPIIHNSDNAPSLVLLEDFGNTTLYSILPNLNDDVIEQYYFQAFDALISLQKSTLQLPDYNHELLSAETDLYDVWYCQQFLKKPLTTQHQQDFIQCKTMLHNAMADSTQIPVHRDYHSRNLMCVNNTIGVIDFQDAVIGCCAYDMVSLLRDAYVERSLTTQKKWLQDYWIRARAQSIALPNDFDDFYNLYNITAIQRGLKVLGIFARLAIRDGKKHYLNDMPLVYRHLIEATQALNNSTIPLQFLQHYAPPSCKQ